MLKEVTLLVLILSVFFIIYQTSQPDESYRPFVTLYGTNPIRQRRGGWRNYPFGWAQPGCPDCPGGCPNCPYSQKGMYTSPYGDVCSRYGSSNVDVDASVYYMGSRWCPVGVVTNQNEPDKVSSTQALEARFMGNSWSFRVRDGLTGMSIYLNTVGQGPYGAYRDGDVVQIPGKAGDWKIQIQTQYQPYLLYLPF
jgi:hypothetical protein